MNTLLATYQPFKPPRVVTVRLTVHAEIEVISGSDDNAIQGVVEDLEALSNQPAGSRKVRFVVSDVE